MNFPQHYGRQVLVTHASGNYGRALLKDAESVLNYIEVSESRRTIASMSVAIYDAISKEPSIFDRIFFDFDSKNNKREAEDDAIRFVEHLEGMGIKAPAFETRKGFHVYIFFKDFLKVKGREIYPLLFKYFAPPEVYKTIDVQVADWQRLARIPFTVHEVSGELVGPATWSYYKGISYYRANGLPNDLRDEIVAKGLLGVKKPIVKPFKRRTYRSKSYPCGEADEYGLPPCTSSVLKSLLSGMNPPHDQRFALVCDLLRLRYSVEEIVKFFSNAADFNEKKTRYQVGHIMRKGYKRPTCEWRVSRNMYCKKVIIKS
ncbi:MAG: hypothetical protein QXR62_03600 [Candidatus Bathyarchaeia archaeon]